MKGTRIRIRVVRNRGKFTSKSTKIYKNIIFFFLENNEELKKNMSIIQKEKIKLKVQLRIRLWNNHIKKKISIHPEREKLN